MQMEDLWFNLNIDTKKWSFLKGPVTFSKPSFLGIHVSFRECMSCSIWKMMDERVMGLQSAVADERMASAADVGVFFEKMQFSPKSFSFGCIYIYIIRCMYYVCIYSTCTD